MRNDVALYFQSVNSISTGSTKFVYDGADALRDLNADLDLPPKTGRESDMIGMSGGEGECLKGYRAKPRSFAAMKRPDAGLT